MSGFTNLLRRNGKIRNEEALAEAVVAYLKQGDESILLDPSKRLPFLGRIFDVTTFDWSNYAWTSEEEAFLNLALAGHSKSPRDFLLADGVEILFIGIAIKYHREALFGEDHFPVLLGKLRDGGFDDQQIRRLVCQSEGHPWKNWFVPEDPASPSWKTGFEGYVWSLPDEELVDLMNRLGIVKQPLAFSLLRFRPKTFRQWINQANIGGFRVKPNLARPGLLREVMQFTTEYDDAIGRMIPLCDDTSTLHEIHSLRPDKFHEQKIKSALSLGTSGSYALLAEIAPQVLIGELQKELLAGTLWSDFIPPPKVWDACAREIGNGARPIFDALLSAARPWHRIDGAVRALVSKAPPDEFDYVTDFCSRAADLVEPDSIGRIWSAISENAAFLSPYVDQMKKALENKNLRSSAEYNLSKASREDYAGHCRELLSSGEKEKVTLGFCLIGNSSTVDGKKILLELLTTVSQKSLRERILKKLESLGVNLDSYRSEPPKKPVPMADPEVPKGQRKPVVKWMDLTSLPRLRRKNGDEAGEAAAWFLIEVQKKFGEIGSAQDAQQLFASLDPVGNADFAFHLLSAFLGSEQKASDRWALTLGGLLGDNRTITLLLPRINDWCENSRHKLAEYAAQAISLLPGNEPLMVLDTLSNRYRSKFKNVGKACAEAFNAAATARGITTDELGDLVVPDLGFDSEGIRRFDWEGGGASAELGAEFKLTWFDPESDKAWKALPGNAPEKIRTEVKTLTKLLREAAKGQTARLEMTLVRQRRWPVARWRELFENHPLLRSFASSLVWGVYNATGTLLRTFRRYPNGLLADAIGGLEELAESDTMIGMIHPLEMDAALLDAWRAHLSRFKVKQPFPQIDRPLELRDPLHGNRREVSFTNGKKLSAGTFRSRAEKRGWNRGSVVDAGGISSYYKLYPGAGVEVILPTNDFWIGCDPMDTLELCAAYFAKAGSIERGSYIYNEPSPDDPRVLRFDAVPAVVWSETISDLKAIIATKE